MNITNINGRWDKDGKHNDRNFDLSKAAHIDQERLKNDIYWTYLEESCYTAEEAKDKKSFLDTEIGFYAEMFSEYLEKQNKKYKKHGNKSRVKTIERYYKGAYTKPEDKILQIGDIYEHASADDLWECALEYQRRFNKLWGDKCRIITMALHNDESTPHVHIRRVWIAEEEEGIYKVSENKALEQLDIGRRDLSKGSSKKNNGKIEFTKLDMQLFYKICKERQLQVAEPSTALTLGEPEHLSSEEYIKQQMCIDIGREIEHTYSCYHNSTLGKSDKEFLKDVVAQIDRGEEIPVNTALEFEIRRQRVLAKRKGYYNQYQKDMMVYIQQLQQAEARRTNGTVEEIQEESGVQPSSGISKINKISSPGIEDFY